MPYTIFRTLVESMGFCCPYAFIRAVRGRSHPQVASRLGVSPETIKYWRKKVRRYATSCLHPDQKRCAYSRFKREIPRIELLSLREGVSDPFV